LVVSAAILSGYVTPMAETTGIIITNSDHKGNITT